MHVTFFCFFFCFFFLEDRAYHKSLHYTYNWPRIVNGNVHVSLCKFTNYWILSSSKKGQISVIPEETAIHASLMALF